MDDSVKLSLMQRSIEEARRSTAEDDRLHPKVGAILAQPDGKILLTAHRGEGGAGGHAEFTLLRKAEEQRLAPKGLSLFVTLEPCTRRSEEKIPCAVRVAKSGIENVYFGTLDPNPHIIGRGVSYLSKQGIAVEQFPPHLQTELHNMNAPFEAVHDYLSDPIFSEEMGEGSTPKQRSGILASSLDMIASTRERADIFTGDTTWIGELFVGLLESTLRGLPIRMLVQKPVSSSLVGIANSLGLEVGEAKEDLRVRGMLSLGPGEQGSMILVEKRPARHALLYSSPHEASVLRIFTRAFAEAWRTCAIAPAKPPEFRPIPMPDIAAVLQRHVPQYFDAEIVLDEVKLARILPMTTDIEVFKLRRAASLSRIAKDYDLSGPVHVVGTPWSFFPPIVERNSQGDLVLIDGNHRVYHAGQIGREDMRAIVVSGVTAPLPAVVVDASQSRIVAEKRNREVRYADYKPEQFRPIRQALRHGPWISTPDTATAPIGAADRTTGD